MSRLDPWGADLSPDTGWVPDPATHDKRCGCDGRCIAAEDARVEYEIEARQLERAFRDG